MTTNSLSAPACSSPTPSLVHESSLVVRMLLLYVRRSNKGSLFSWAEFFVAAGPTHQRSEFVLWTTFCVLCKLSIGHLERLQNASSCVHLFEMYVWAQNRVHKSGVRLWKFVQRWFAVKVHYGSAPNSPFYSIVKETFFFIFSLYRDM